MNRFCIVFLLFYFIPFCAVAAQDVVPTREDSAATSGKTSVLKGVVWQAPPGIAAAERDLLNMQESGVEAIRTGIIRNNRLLSLADTIGMALYVELPIAHMPASRLSDTLAYASAWLDTVAGLARIHSSIRAIGFARYADTSDSTSCVFFKELGRRAAENMPPYVQTYYITRFIDDDRCSGEVDFVLADLRDVDDPVRRLRESRGGMGVGALGIWVRADTASGLYVPGSVEMQARYFETHLPILLSDTLSLDLRAVFVHRWRDARFEHPLNTKGPGDPFVDRYGLRSAEDVPRPAMDVVEGILTGRQTVFAFKAGRPAGEDTGWPVFLGWAVILMMGTFYALSPRFRHMVPRYFKAHFFFRESVREGRDVLFGASTVLLSALSAAFGMVFATVLTAVRETDAFLTGVAWMPPALQNVVLTLLENPLVMVLLAGCFYAVATLIWTTVLSIFSRRRYRISAAQGLMLILWPRWPQLVVLLAAMVVGSTSSQDVLPALVLGASWIVIATAATLRTVIDFEAVTRIPVYLLLPVLLLYPAIPAAVVLFFALMPYEPELTFLWHLATRG